MIKKENIHHNIIVKLMVTDPVQLFINWCLIDDTATTMEQKTHIIIRLRNNEITIQYGNHDNHIQNYTGPG